MSVPVSENLSVSHYQLNVSAANIERHEDAVLEHVLQSCPHSEHRFFAKEVCVCVCVCMCVCTSFRVSLSLCFSDSWAEQAQSNWDVGLVCSAPGPRPLSQ